MKKLIRLGVVEDYENLIKKLVISEPLGEIIISGKHIETISDRYRNFYLHGYQCCECGLHVEFAAIERPSDTKKCHINLYGRKDGKEVLFTKDHIYPRSLGGLDIVENYQVMCEKCNSKKSNKTLISAEEAIAAGYTTIEAVTAVQRYNLQKEKCRKLKEELEQQEKLLAKAQLEFKKYVPKRPRESYLLTDYYKKIKKEKKYVKN